MIYLNNYGWNDKLSQLKQESTYNALTHGRISIVHRTCYEVVSENGLFQCELTGNMMYGKSDFELPCTGDWVLFQPFDEHKGIIVDMRLPINRPLPRMLTRHLSCKVLMIISMFAEPSVSWFRCRKRILILYWCSIRLI